LNQIHLINAGPGSLLLGFELLFGVPFFFPPAARDKPISEQARIALPVCVAH
jgi:hypothetical protein